MQSRILALARAGLKLKELSAFQCCQARRSSWKNELLATAMATSNLQKDRTLILVSGCMITVAGNWPAGRAIAVGRAAPGPGLRPERASDPVAVG